MAKAVILGAGVMGSAMCLPFTARGLDVALVGTHLDRHIVESVQASGLHPKLKVTLPGSVKAFQHEEFATAVDGETGFILLGVSSAGVSWAIEKLAQVLTRPLPVVMITKGMQPLAASLGTLPDTVASALRQRLGFDVPVAAIGGPCIAGELAAGRPTGTVIVSRDSELAQRLAASFSCDFYMGRASTDMMGVEACAAFKNFYAITVGWAIGRQDVLPPTENKALNHNAAAILFDQAVREMMVLVRALGGDSASVWGMPGVGDLYVTCQAGRNSRLGHALGRGMTYAEAMAGPLKDETVEGAELGLAVAGSLRNMARTGLVDVGKLPVAFALLDTLTEGKPFNPPWDRMHHQG